MATRLFQYGDFKAVPRQNEWLTGVFATEHGVNLNKTGFKPINLTIEYGEIVALAQNGLDANAGYNISRVEASSTKFGVVLRTTDGQIGVEDDFIERPRSRTAVSIYPLASVNNFQVAVPVEAGQEPVVGGAVYVSVASGKEGAVRTSAGTNEGVALAGWTFATTKYKPTKGSGEAVIIQRVI